jgi:hypothetical protein
MKALQRRAWRAKWTDMNARGRLRLAASCAAALLVACTERPTPPTPARSTTRAHQTPAAAFPELPATPEAAEELVRRETARPVAAERAGDAGAILAAVAARPAAVVAGDGAVTRWIQAVLDRAPGDAYVLFGTWHDAPGQIDAFRRLAGPGGLRGIDLVAVELFRADGAWGGAPLEIQRGDGAAIEAYLASGDREAFAGLARSHRDADYAAWKLGYEPAVLDLLVEARATGVRLLGCDMPRALQEKIGAPPGDLRNRLREIHCLRSLPPAPGGKPRHAALLWGEAHVQPDGLRRFLPPAAAVLSLHVFGRRMEAGPAETALAKELAVVEPALVPLGPDDAALLLPDATLGGHVDRVLAGAEQGEAVQPGLVVRAEEAGTIFVGGRSVPVGPEAVTVALPEGDHPYVLASGGRRAVGAIRMMAGHRVELGFDPRSGLVGYVDRAPR